MCRVIVVVGILALIAVQPGCTSSPGGGGSGGAGGDGAGNDPNNQVLGDVGGTGSPSGGGVVDDDGQGTDAQEAAVTYFVPDPEPADCLGLLELPTEPVRRDLFFLVNAYRTENGIQALSYSTTLQDAADAFAERIYHGMMADPAFFNGLVTTGHVEPDGTTVAERVMDAGFCHARVGENILWGLNSRSNPRAAQEEFQNSPAHNQNLLDTSFRYVGIGYYHATVELDDYYYWVQIFAVDKDN